MFKDFYKHGKGEKKKKKNWNKGWNGGLVILEEKEKKLIGKTDQQLQSHLKFLSLLKDKADKIFLCMQNNFGGGAFLYIYFLVIEIEA